MYNIFKNAKEGTKMEIDTARHAFPEKKGFEINRPHGRPYYVFVHIWTPVEIYHNDPERRFMTKENACMIFDIGQEQFWKNPSDGFLHDWIHINGDLPSLMREAGLEFGRIYYPRSPSFITEDVRTIEFEQALKMPFYGEICDLKLRQMLLKIARNASTPDVKQTSTDRETEEKFRLLRQEMLGSLDQKLTVPELASRIPMSTSRFHTVYKELFGISPTADIINARIESAKNYLSNGSYSVEEVAALTGYSSVFCFIRQFKSTTGMTPGEYKKTEP